MNVKTKMVGLFAGAALALGLITGTMAQDDTGNTTVVLQDGACTGSISTATVDFGTYVFDGTGFDYQDGESGTTFNLTATDGTIEKNGCEIVIAASPLSDGDGGPTIPVTIWATSDVSDSGAQLTLTVLGTGSEEINAVMSFMDGVSYDVGTYTGTITVSGSAAS